MVRYRYTPLPGNNYIRLATIHPGKFEDDIVISFRTLPFPGPEYEYEALSYAWGSKEDPLPVYVSRCDVGTASAAQQTCKVKLKSILTTRNLDIALRHLRYVDKPRVMWIDALCIHQADAIEKGPQVAMMGDIFRLAHRVVVWLGPEENDSNHAMDLMHSLGSQVEVNYRMATMSAADGCTDPSLGDANALLPLDAKGLRSVYHLISRQWFERLWVRQEIQLANSNAVVMCGFRQVQWSITRRALYCVFRKPRRMFELTRELKARWAYIFGLLWYRDYTTILELRRDYQSCQCLTALDRLYAILAILPEHERAFIPSPDYTIPYVKLYTTVTKQWISYYRQLGILGVCHFQDGGPCPSWVPDWSKPTTLEQSSNSDKASEQNASSQLQSWHEFPQPGLLRIMGISRATVKQHYQVPDLKNRKTRLVFEEIRGLVLRLNQSKPLTIESYARVLFANTFKDDFDPPLTSRANLNEAKQLVELMLSDYQFNIDDFSISTLHFKSVEVVVSSTSGLQLIQTTDGRLGLASDSVRSGDKICCVLGCQTLLLLRPLENGTFKVVSPCLVPEFANGATFLRPLPENFRPVQVYNKAASRYESGFRDVSSGEITYEDPRLKSLPLDPGYLDSFRERLDRHHTVSIYVDPEILRKSGVDLRCFDLV
ncbi:HET-domain-containing protein [Hypoxylon rubiginosum]|uniref:HET-domain-containing protein n=1 Tax=Hypoxylon rubiginosum TaxID=110542 RepID=A0ACB9Z6T3_9PEZI|nr:HET-domain-containing protein [Hypoxylon rubiginosum]